MTRFSGDVFRGDILTVKLVGNLHGDRKFCITGAAVIDVLAVGLPGNGSVRVALIGFIAGDILDILQTGFIEECSASFGILQPVTDNDRLLVTGCVGDDIDCFIFSGSAFRFCFPFLSVDADSGKSHCAGCHTRKYGASDFIHTFHKIWPPLISAFLRHGRFIDERIEDQQ